VANEGLCLWPGQVALRRPRSSYSYCRRLAVSVLEVGGSLSEWPLTTALRGTGASSGLGSTRESAAWPLSMVDKRLAASGLGETRR